METIYQTLKKRTQQIAAQYPVPSFYRRYALESSYSEDFFNKNKFVLSLKEIVSSHLSENLGHGFEHASKVSVDAGALVLIEARLAGFSRPAIDRLLLLSQSAGLLHDISRTEEDHSRKGAKVARELLKGHALEASEIDDICRAIYNHEAFKTTVSSLTQTGSIISDCLYDADKFRWGKDNFSHTLWDMVQSSNTPIASFVAHFPKGMDTLVKIRETFRTRTGKKYGPDFIDNGIAIGRELYRVMEEEYQLLS
jgi:hypothetical protein